MCLLCVLGGVCTRRRNGGSKKKPHHRFYLISAGGDGMWVRRAPGRTAGGFGMVKDREENGVSLYVMMPGARRASVRKYLRDCGRACFMIFVLLLCKASSLSSPKNTKLHKKHTLRWSAHMTHKTLSTFWSATRFTWTHCYNLVT